MDEIQISEELKSIEDKFNDAIDLFGSPETRLSDEENVKLMASLYASLKKLKIYAERPGK